MQIYGNADFSSHKGQTLETLENTVVFTMGHPFTLLVSVP